jgi:hypothetical protein
MHGFTFAQSALRGAMALLILAASAWMHPVQAQAAADRAPVLLFSDLASGPRSGNSDDSQPGQTAGVDGAIVTVWGKRLGTVAGRVRVGGIDARIYMWGNATAPADLSSQHGMQMIAFQIPAQVAEGATTIEAVARNGVSNALPFTVRAGSIRFVKTSGNDTSGDGSWQRPWAKVSRATLALDAGSIVYVGDGVWQNAPDGDRSTLDLDRDPARLGTAALPKALIGYPGADARIGTEDLNAWSTFVSGSPSPSTYWTIAKLRLQGRHVAASYHTGFRLVGNHVSAPRGDDQTGAIGGIDSAELFVLGNELTNIGYPGTSKLYHPMYIQSAERNEPPRLPPSANRQIGWNYLHDNYAFDGINLYREGSHSAYMTNTRVHDNVIVNQTGRGMLIGTYLTGDDNHIYNNVIVNAGLGPPPAGPFANDPAFGYVCVDINAGAVGNPPTTIHFYNNTLVGCGFAGGPLNTAGMVSVGNAYDFALDFRNNIVVSEGFPFVTPYSTTQKTSADANLWFGSGGVVPDPAAPEIFAGAIQGDPRFVNRATLNLRLGSGSAAIDGGSSVAPVPTVDFDWITRPKGAGIDLGAFESRRARRP